MLTNDKSCSTCIFFETWQENQAPLGSGHSWMETFEECTCEEGDLDDKWPADGTCEFHRFLPIASCLKHKEEFFVSEGCGSCFCEKNGELLDRLGKYFARDERDQIGFEKDTILG